MRVVNADDECKPETKQEESCKDKVPKPESCALLRNFLELCLYEIKEMWIKRLYYVMSVECTCCRPCYLHDVGGCKDEECVHFLQLDECLVNRVSH